MSIFLWKMGFKLAAGVARETARALQSEEERRRIEEERERERRENRVRHAIAYTVFLIVVSLIIWLWIHLAAGSPHIPQQPAPY